MTADAVVQVGLIGAGNFARHQHLPNLHRIPEARWRAICDVKADLAGQLADKYAADYGTGDHRRVLDDAAIDAVVIAVRDDLQAPLAVEALQAGKHVYVEKPLAETAEAAEAVVAAQAASGRRLAVGLNRRYAPIYRAMREVAAADGGPRNVHIHMADDAWRWAVNYPPGFLLPLDACHLFDLLRWLSGSEIARVYCVSSRPDDDCVSVTMADGCVASILLSGHGTMDMPKERTDVICTRGGCSGEDFVELRTYGYEAFPHVRHFAGHSHPDGEFANKYLCEQLGADALRGLRRVTWQLRQRIEAGADAGEPDAAEARTFVGKTIPNFLRDQGWLAALRAFVVGIATGEPTDHAGARDALAAVLAARAAAESRRTGLPVDLT